jgi:hypothetical protein
MAKKRRAGDRSDQSAKPQVVGPLPLVKTRLLRLASKGETWQADFRPPPAGFPPLEDATEPWFVLVISEATQLVHLCKVLAVRPSADELWDALAEAMQESIAKDSQRPAVLRVGSEPVWEQLRPHLQEIHVKLESGMPLVVLDDLMKQMMDHVSSQSAVEVVPLLEVLDVAAAGSFYEAASSFYCEAPWAAYEDEGAIEVRCPQLGGGPWYAVIMGQAGMTYGLAIYEDLDWLKHVWTEEVTESEQVAGTVATAMTFGPKDAILKEDLAAMKQHGWKPANPRAYPEAYHTELGMTMRMPTAEEFRLLDTCLRAVPPFVRKRGQDDTTPETIAVKLPSGPVTVTLAWVPI